MAIVALAQHLPVPFIARLSVALAEMVLAAAVLVGSVIVGHELKDWRDWFWDQETTHPWAPTPKPTPAETVEITAP
jgi:hypothetical protein